MSDVSRVVSCQKSAVIVSVKFKCNYFNDYLYSRGSVAIMEGTRGHILELMVMGILLG